MTATWLKHKLNYFAGSGWNGIMMCLRLKMICVWSKVTIPLQGVVDLLRLHHVLPCLHHHCWWGSNSPHSPPKSGSWKKRWALWKSVKYSYLSTTVKTWHVHPIQISSFLAFKSSFLDQIITSEEIQLRKSIIVFKN